jgi:hypothetical protein
MTQAVCWGRYGYFDGYMQRIKEGSRRKESTPHAYHINNRNDEATAKE